MVLLQVLQLLDLQLKVDHQLVLTNLFFQSNISQGGTFMPVLQLLDKNLQL